MQKRSFILRSAAFFLVLIFSQKAGTGLFLHNLLHTKSAKEVPHQQNKNDLNYACTCVDDFLTPFTETEEFVCIQNISEHVIPVTFFEARISFRAPVHSSLRGPPANIL
ncbi:MAG: hypothetical protein WDN26_09570 [Chitinophagaceae bacterium]